MTQPMFAGIITSFAGKRPGLAMGFNVFSLLIRAGVGSVVFGTLEPHSFALALGSFAVLEIVLADVPHIVFRSEGPNAMLHRNWDDTSHPFQPCYLNFRRMCCCASQLLLPRMGHRSNPKKGGPDGCFTPRANPVRVYRFVSHHLSCFEHRALELHRRT
ncbi:hypothetical protein [Burkholderia cepacia]|uniref:hypothetical protein n=1 Tax=Burkholderia cepacia TaxID=292 RepID=UPI002AB72722|nr:hypothetical protein [Burkholderia cepacia]